MNRLINQYGAFQTPLGEKALELIREFEQKVITFIKTNDLTPEEIRALSSIVNADISCAEAILIKVMAMKKAERAAGKA